MRSFVKVILSIVMLASPVLLRAQDGGEVVIILEDNGNTGGGAVFHAPARIPIECLYHPDLSTIIAFFRYDMGSVFIQIENHSTGECDQVTVNALAGAMPFPISGSPGYWSISFLLCNGKEYCGEFEI